MVFSRIVNIGKIVSVFFVLQLCIQLLDAVSGVLIVRSLSKSDYAYFGIISSLSVSVLNVIISGLLSYFVSEGVALKNDRPAFSKLFSELSIFLYKKLVPYFLLALPFLFFILLKNNFSVYKICCLVPFVFVELILRIRLQQFQSILSIYKKFNELQIVSVLASALRVVLILFSFSFLKAEFAYLSMVFSYLVQYLFIKKLATRFLIKTDVDHSRNSEFKKLHNSQFPLTLYAGLDAQIAIILMSFLGGTQLLGDFNAAGKLGVFFIAISAFVNNVLIAKFADIKGRKEFIKLEIGVIGILLMVYSISVTVAWLKPEIVIMIIGEKYSNLSPLLYLSVLGLCVGNLASTIYSINYSRVWIKSNWITIPLTIMAQIVGLIFTPPNSFFNVGIYIILCAIPSLLTFLYFNLKGVYEIADN
jgi:O-antigen/teichoic acid export membrane protein